MGVRATVDELAGHKIAVHCMALGGADLTSSAGRMTMAVIAAVAEFERDLLIERTQAGLRRAKEQGKALGRRCALPSAVRDEIRVERQGGSSLDALAKKYGVLRSAIQRIERALNQLCQGRTGDEGASHLMRHPQVGRSANC